MKSDKAKRVTFIHTPCSELDNDRLEPPLGILYMATLLKKQGIKCHICNLSGLPEEKWLENLASRNGDIFAFSTYSVTYHRTLKIKDMVNKLNPKAITIAGGPHVSALPNESAKDFDIIITDEAEVTFTEIIQDIQKGRNVKGIFKGEFVKDLNLLPFPNYDLVNLPSYSRVVEGLPSISLITSRGCPYNCTFCNSRVFARGELRFRSPENVVKEILSLQKKYNTSNFRFSDDLFTFSPKRITEMTSALKPLNIHYRVFARSNSLTKETACKLYDSGCRHVAIGIESMSSKMLSLLKKKTTVEINIKALKNAKEAGLKVRIYLLIGFPGETEKTIKESLDILLSCDFDEFIVYPFIPYPGTDVWDNPEKYNARIDRDYSKYVQIGKNRSTCFAVTTDEFTPKDVELWRQTMINQLEEKFLWAGKSTENR